MKYSQTARSFLVGSNHIRNPRTTSFGARYPYGRFPRRRLNVTAQRDVASEISLHLIVIFLMVNNQPTLRTSLYGRVLEPQKVSIPRWRRVNHPSCESYDDKCQCR